MATLSSVGAILGPKSEGAGEPVGDNVVVVLLPVTLGTVDDADVPEEVTGGAGMRVTVRVRRRRVRLPGDELSVAVRLADGCDTEGVGHEGVPNVAERDTVTSADGVGDAVSDMVLVRFLPMPPAASTPAGAPSHAKQAATTTKQKRGVPPMAARSPADGPYGREEGGGGGTTPYTRLHRTVWGVPGKLASTRSRPPFPTLWPNIGTC